jgi:hypothetical protein
LMASESQGNETWKSGALHRVEPVTGRHAC